MINNREIRNRLENAKCLFIFLMKASLKSLSVAIFAEQLRANAFEF